MTSKSAQIPTQLRQGQRGEQSKISKFKDKISRKISDRKKKSKERKQARALIPGWVCCQCHYYEAESRYSGTVCQHDNHPTWPQHGNKCQECKDVVPIGTSDISSEDSTQNTGSETGWFCNACFRHYPDRTSLKHCVNCGARGADRYTETVEIESP
ncbi:hypothetical protein BU26DRAFT_563861 [Trematosphaeria pertusa]|uniref:Uncharacterized protein n=1 Tax=Trematosphaeria pertusa TaxID=390896 RepID=A0A6A6IJC1_9PLEO|nr:uncharacterized protein BU26DRAFT_563861 [Trematosphaeria pertusa]KAF2249972.1 hypothetical protein BU26DRAFT_563861 [Trematosphaeria pertusa]